MLLLELNVGALRLLLRPDAGGSVAGLWRDGVPVLRSAADGAIEGPRHSGGFAMVPYCGRIAQRRFVFAGAEHVLAPNVDNSPHSLHGVGWLRPWEVASAGPSEAELVLRHAPDADWPFAFEARQRFVLDAAGLRLELSLRNTHDAPAPLGLGWHPYVLRRSRSRLHLEARERWEHDETKIPVKRVPCTGVDGDVAPMDWDHAFEGWTGSARLRDERHSLRLSASLNRVLVFTPRDRDVYCVEPISHAINAIHAADPAALGLTIAAPGQGIEAWVRLDIAAA